MLLQVLRLTASELPWSTILVAVFRMIIQGRLSFGRPFWRLSTFSAKPQTWTLRRVQSSVKLKQMDFEGPVSIRRTNIRS